MLSISDSIFLDYEIVSNFSLELEVTDGVNDTIHNLKMVMNDLGEFDIDPFLGLKRTGSVNFVIDSTVYIGLGNDEDSVFCNFMKYDISTNKWSKIASFPGTPRSEAVAFVLNEKAYVGLGRSEFPYIYYKDFYEYNPEINQWIQVAEFGGTARYNAVAFAIDSLGYVGIGKDATDEQKDFWKYDPELDSWSQVSDINGDKRHSASAFVIKEKAYVSGGQYFDSYTVQLSDVREYDPVIDVWEEKIFADGINLSINDAATLVMGDIGYICFGNKSNIVSYNPLTNDITNYGDLLELGNNQFDPVAFILNHTAYFGLGYNTVNPNYKNDILELNHFPTNIVLSYDTIVENNSVNTIIGVFSTEDNDQTENHTYNLASGNGINDSDNGSFVIDGIELKSTEVFDFETNSDCNISMEVVDSLGANHQKSFVIHIKDINETPSDITLTANSINENHSIGTVIGAFYTADEDTSDTHNYSLVAGNGSNDLDNNSFSISGNELQSAEILNHEAQSVYNIYIETKDQNGNVFKKAFVINTTDVNEDPTEIVLSTNMIDENSTVGTAIGTFSSVDEDIGNTHTYSFVAGNRPNDIGNGSFSISGSDLHNAEVFDFETQSEYYIFVETSDGNGGAFQKAFVVTVTDLVEVGIQNYPEVILKSFQIQQMDYLILITLNRNLTNCM